MRKIIFIILSLTFFTRVFAGGVEIGNGGDIVVSEFKFLGQLTIKHLPKQSRVLSLDQITNLKNIITNASIESKDYTILNGKEVDAINYPEAQKIVVSRNRWLAPGQDFRSRHWALALHEYLWLMGIDDSDYVLSNQVFQEVSAAYNSWLSSPISKALTQAVCSGIIGRDINLVNQALSMGADLSTLCNKDIEFSCPNGARDTIHYTSPTSPLEIAMETAGDNKCTGTRMDPDLDFESSAIFDRLLAYNPEINKNVYGHQNDSLLSMSARMRLFNFYVSLLNAGANPNANADYAGLLRWYPFTDVRFFKAAHKAGANINLPSTFNPQITISIGILNIYNSSSPWAKEHLEVVKYFLDTAQINFCLSSAYPNRYFDQRPIKDAASYELRALIENSGLPCVK